MQTLSKYTGAVSEVLKPNLSIFGPIVTPFASEGTIIKDLFL